MKTIKQTTASPQSSKSSDKDPRKVMGLHCSLKGPLERNDSGIVSRIYITEDGDVIVSDLWKELGEALTRRGDFDVI